MDFTEGSTLWVIPLFCRSVHNTLKLNQLLHDSLLPSIEVIFISSP